MRRRDCNAGIARDGTVPGAGPAFLAGARVAWLWGVPAGWGCHSGRLRHRGRHATPKDHSQPEPRLHCGGCRPAERVPHQARPILRDSVRTAPAVVRARGGMGGYAEHLSPAASGDARGLSGRRVVLFAARLSADPQPGRGIVRSAAVRSAAAAVCALVLQQQGPAVSQHVHGDVVRDAPGVPAGHRGGVRAVRGMRGRADESADHGGAAVPGGAGAAGAGPAAGRSGSANPRPGDGGGVRAGRAGHVVRAVALLVGGPVRVRHGGTDLGASPLHSP